MATSRATAIHNTIPHKRHSTFRFQIRVLRHGEHCELPGRLPLQLCRLPPRRPTGHLQLDTNLTRLVELLQRSELHGDREQRQVI